MQSMFDTFDADLWNLKMGSPGPDADFAVHRSWR